jgi:hypothetical protein
MSEFIASKVWPDARIEQSIFGTDDASEIWRQVLEVCPEAVECFAFEVSVGALFGLRLRDGSRVALKIHTGRFDQGHLEAVQQVQRHLWTCGFPCPKPLGVYERATIEQWREEGEYRDARDPQIRRVIAEKLAELFRLTLPLQPLPGLEPYSRPADAPLWPVPHNVLFDFEGTAAGAEWIDEIARSAKTPRDVRVGQLVIGHGDWTVKHFRFDGVRPTVIYDWDSLNADFETIFVGGSAASFTYAEYVAGPLWPDVPEAAAFLADYEQARRAPFSGEEWRAARAAAVYSRAYASRCVHAVGGDATRLGLHEYAEAFLGPAPPSGSGV